MAGGSGRVVGDLSRGGVAVAVVAVAVVDLLAADSKIETDIAAFRSLSCQGHSDAMVKERQTNRQMQGFLVAVTVTDSDR